MINLRQGGAGGQLLPDDRNCVRESVPRVPRQGGLDRVAQALGATPKGEKPRRAGFTQQKKPPGWLFLFGHFYQQPGPNYRATVNLD